MRITRASAVDVLNEDYVRTANAKGLSSKVVDNRHVLRNAMLPVITVIGLQTGLLLGGAILTETIFGWGGVGKWMYDAVLSNDYQIIQSGVLLLAVIFVARQPRGRHQLRLPEPEDPVLVSSVATTFDAVVEDKPVGLWRDAFRRMRHNPSAIIGAMIVGAMVFMAVLAPFLAPYDPLRGNLSRELPAAVGPALDGDEHPGPGRAVADHLGGSTHARHRRALGHVRRHRRRIPRRDRRLLQGRDRRRSSCARSTSCWRFPGCCWPSAS